VRGYSSRVQRRYAFPQGRTHLKGAALQHTLQVLAARSDRTQLEGCDSKQHPRCRIGTMQHFTGSKAPLAATTAAQPRQATRPCPPSPPILQQDTSRALPPVLQGQVTFSCSNCYRHHSLYPHKAARRLRFG